MAAGIGALGYVSSPQAHSPAEARQENVLGFQLTLQKVEELIREKEMPLSESGHRIDPERVKALSASLWSYIQQSNPIPTEEALKEEIDAWTNPVKWIETHEEENDPGHSMKVMVLRNDNGLLGRGGESHVFRGVLEPQGNCAVKLMHAPKDDEGIEALDKLLRDICQNRYLVHYYGFKDDWFEVFNEETQELEWKVEQYLVEELCSESLLDLCENAKPSSGNIEAARRLDHHLFSFVEQLLSGVAYMHSRGVVHGDIKMENILLSQKGDEIRISDLNGVFTVDTKPRASTISCAAPEQVPYYGSLFDSKLLDTEEPGPSFYCKESEVWQVMLLIGQMGQCRLSDAFLDRILDCVEACEGYEEKAGQEALEDFRSKSCPDLMHAIKGRFFVDKAAPYFVGMQKEREGLFSDLSPTNGLENLLVRMSTFNPEDRISAEEALQMVKSGLLNN